MLHKIGGNLTPWHRVLSEIPPVLLELKGVFGGAIECRYHPGPALAELFEVVLQKEVLPDSETVVVALHINKDPHAITILDEDRKRLQEHTRLVLRGDIPENLARIEFAAKARLTKAVEAPVKEAMKAYSAAVGGLTGDQATALDVAITNLVQEFAREAIARFASTLDEVVANVKEQIAPTPTTRRPGRPRRRDLGNLEQNYARLILRWQGAKRHFGDSQGAAGWPVTIKDENPDFPDDLIARLDPEFRGSEDLATRLLEKGGGDAPSDLALEHAARECGCSDYEYTLKHLSNLASTQRARKKSEEQLRKAKAAEREALRRFAIFDSLNN